MVPIGGTDNARVLPTPANKVAAYKLLAKKMFVDYKNSNLSILESVNALDLWELKSLAFYPLQYVNRTNFIMPKSTASWFSFQVIVTSKRISRRL